jgi:hypothetical protein
VINESRRKYRKYRDITNIEQDLIIYRPVPVLKGFSNFQYLGKLKIYKSEEIKSRIAAGKRCLYRLRCTLRSRCTNKAIKINISDMKVKPVAVYGSATWRVRVADMKGLNTC